MPLPETCPLTEFRRDAAGYLKRLRKSKKHLLLTQDGRAAGVVLSTAEYDRLIAEMEAAEVRKALAEAIAQRRAGKGVSLEQSVARAHATIAQAGGKRRRTA